MTGEDASSAERSSADRSSGHGPREDEASGLGTASGEQGGIEDPSSRANGREAPVSRERPASDESVDVKTESREPDTYDPDRDGAFSAWLRDRADWEAATRHRFVEEYRDGDLADDVFRRYLVQDYQFLEAGARLTAHAASQAHAMGEMNRLAESLTVLTGGENDYFRRAFDDLDVPESEREDPPLHPTTAAFNDFQLRAATEGAYEEALAVIAPAEWIYRDWCGYVAAGDADFDRWYLEEWIEIHDTDEFDAYTGWLIDQLDTYGPRLSPERQARVAEIFDRTVDLEAAFFDAADE